MGRLFMLHIQFKYWRRRRCVLTNVSPRARDIGRRHGIGTFGNEASMRDLHHQTRCVEWQEMGDILNLRQARKNAKRRAAEQKAAANRLLHGRGKSDRELEAARNSKERRDLDRHRIEKADEQ